MLAIAHLPHVCAATAEKSKGVAGGTQHGGGGGCLYRCVIPVHILREDVAAVVVEALFSEGAAWGRLRMCHHTARQVGLAGPQRH